MKRYSWQKLRMIGWSLLFISLIIRLIFNLLKINNIYIQPISYFVSLLGIIFVASGYWYGEVKFSRN